MVLIETYTTPSLWPSVTHTLPISLIRHGTVCDYSLYQRHRSLGHLKNVSFVYKFQNRIKNKIFFGPVKIQSFAISGTINDIFTITNLIDIAPCMNEKVLTVGL